MLTKLRETIAKYRMLDSGDRVVVAVSGGPDSVCLLHGLRALTQEFGITLHVAHLDHGFRGQESAAEARFVGSLAGQLGIPASVEAFDVPAFCRERGLSPPAGAREARYAFLERIADAVGARRIATGHTATDQAETLLMRLIRGAGVSGLAGIPPKRGRVIRPLIETTREEVLAYVQENRLAFVTDSSNAEPVYTRNRIRLELLPLLETFNPRVGEAAAAAASLLRDEDDAMEAAVADIAGDILLHEQNALRIKRDGFLHLLPAFQRRILRKALETAGSGETLTSRQTGEALRFMATAQSGRSTELLAGLLLEREYDFFVFRSKAGSRAFSVRLTVPGVTMVPELGLAVETSVLQPSAAQHHEGNYRWQALFDYDKITVPLVLRSRQPGDRFRPAGMGGKSKKLHDFFIDEKIPRLLRDRTPLLATSQDVLWVVGRRTDGRFLAGPETKHVLMVGVRTTAETASDSAG